MIGAYPQVRRPAVKRYPINPGGDARKGKDMSHLNFRYSLAHLRLDWASDS